MPEAEPIGFIGLGVMGAPICRNLVTKASDPVLVYDLDPERVAPVVESGALVAESVADIGTRCRIVFMSLPGGPQVEAVADELLPALDARVRTGRGSAGANRGDDGRADAEGPVVVDLTTAPVALTRRLASEAATRGIAWVDAPVARTRAAAQAGTLAVMAGGDARAIERVRPLLSAFGSDISECGPVGCGQIAKLMNNYLLFQNVVALAEVITIARRSGMDPADLLQVISTGSGDSFALRNHATKAMLPADFPKQAFSTSYARKDLSYALALAAQVGLEVPGGELADRLMAKAAASGHGDEYWPTLIHAIDDEL